MTSIKVWKSQNDGLSYPYQKSEQWNDKKPGKEIKKTCSVQMLFTKCNEKSKMLRQIKCIFSSPCRNQPSFGSWSNEFSLFISYQNLRFRVAPIDFVIMCQTNSIWRLLRKDLSVTQVLMIHIWNYNRWDIFMYVYTGLKAKRQVPFLVPIALWHLLFQASAVVQWNQQESLGPKIACR